MKPYTYTKLIAGAAFAYNFSADKFRHAKDLTEKKYWGDQCAKHQEDIHRLRIARACCGDAIVMVR
jgi:hypothetical protein